MKESIARGAAATEMPRFPCDCPRCGATTGFPYRVQTDATSTGRVNIDLRCRSCHNEWHVERTAAAIVTDRPDYLDLPVAWTPSRRFEHGQVYEYRLTLTAGETAILQLVPGRGWAMTIAHGAGQPDSDRGLFATPRDALMVLLAECAPAGDDAEVLTRPTSGWRETAEA
jgi:hypothetical protein